MTSLDTTETKTHSGAITVICSDGARIRVDLNLFPSELLRGVVKSDFADRDEMEILYDSAQFMAIYKSYLPAPADYFQLHAPAALEVNDEIKIISYDGYSFKSGYEGRSKTSHIYSYI